MLVTLSGLWASPGAGQAAAEGANQANWELLERFRAESVERLVPATGVRPNWIRETDAFWYSWSDQEGTRFVLVDSSEPAKEPLFDHEWMASALSRHLETPVEAGDLPVEGIDFAEDAQGFEFVAKGERFYYDLDGSRLESMGEAEDEEDDREWRSFAPDSSAYVYAEDHDLYLVEIVEGEEEPPVRLSDDGERYYSFGSRDVSDDEEDETAGRVPSDAVWSEDGRAFFVDRRDRRHVAEIHHVDHLAEPRPELRSHPYALPGEEEVDQFEVHVLHRDEGELRQLDLETYGDQRYFGIHWVRGGSENLRMIRRSHSRRYLEFIDVHVPSQDVSVLLSEGRTRGKAVHRTPVYLGEDRSGEFLWYSEASGWGHWYRYSHEGELIGPVTQGPWNAEGIEDVDRDEGHVWLTGVGREDGDPYHRHLYRVEIDGSNPMVLDPGDAQHHSSLSPSREYVVNNQSRVDQAPRAVLRDAEGEVILELEEVDVSELEKTGWRAPERFTVTAADGRTEIYGNLWKPFDFDSEASYPVIASVYPGPQHEGVDHEFQVMPPEAELAQLGFIVVQVGNRGGSPLRSRAYATHGYFGLRDYPLADTKEGILELARRNPWIDESRVGIYGHSGGGFMTGAALLVPPYNEFFDVGVASAGNHDNNVYHYSWSVRHHGLEVTCVPRALADESDGPQGSTSSITGSAAPSEERVVGHEGHCDPAREDVEYDIELAANHEMAEHLQGRLLLAHGAVDDNVHPAGTMRLVRELIRHDKRFDLMMFPGMRHSFEDEYEAYWRRIKREYFAEHLLGDYYRERGTIDRPTR